MRTKLTTKMIEFAEACIEDYSIEGLIDDLLKPADKKIMKYWDIKKPSEYKASLAHALEEKIQSKIYYANRRKS